MKSLLNNSKTFLKYALTIMIFSVLLGTIFVVGFGFNASADFGKVYELSIDCFDKNQIKNFTDTAEDILDEYGYSANEILVEDRSYCDTIVIRYKSTSQNNANLIEKDVETKLELKENLVTIASLSKSSEKAPAIKLLITLGVTAVVLFVYGLIRHKWKFALTLTLNYVLSCLLPLALFAITRVEISVLALSVVLLIAGIASVLLMALYQKMQVIAKQQEKEESFKTNYLAYAAENKLKMIIPSALVLLVFVCLIFTFTPSLVGVGLAGIITLIVAAFNLAIFSPALLIALTEGKKTPTTKKDKE